MYLYILECKDGTYYTGVTNDIERRVHEHANGIDTKSYTHSRRPVKLVFVEEFSDPYDAITIEKQIKRWSHNKKSALIAGDWGSLHELAACKNTTSHKRLRR